MEPSSHIIGSPIGDLAVEFSSRGLRSLSLIRDNRNRDDLHGLDDRECSDELSAVKTYISDHFFCRDPGRSGIDLDMEDMSCFRREVYEELMKVRFGELVTYGELAKRVGRPGSARAVGQMMNRNPFLIIVPCHRVMAQDRKGGYSLGGFGAGINVKRVLLRMEGHEGSEIQGL
ncbi:MAG: MGMT family protein [Candidatus Thermoplasmatota archaeon]|nr:MGMT family protein [Candidatus Thermoplasmatota archaeon]